MIEVKVAIAETSKGLRITLDRIADDVHTPSEVQVMHVIYCLLYPLAQKVAADFHARFLRMPPMP